MHVLIATPTSGHVVSTAYTHSLIAATQAIHAVGGSYQHMVFNGTDVVLARNFIANDFLSDAEASHLLFLDSDLLIETPVFARLLAADLPLVGAIYPERELNHRLYRDLLRDGASETQAEAAALRFTARPLDGSYLFRDGLTRVGGLGAGCLLIARPALEQMIEAGTVGRARSRLLETQMGVPELHDFFGLIPTGDGDHLSAEDAFCQRALQAGLEIWGLADMQISHMGRQAYSGRFVDHLEHHATRQDG